MPSASFLSVYASGLFLGASLIVAIGAQNAFVLRQGLRREHVLPVVALCALIDLALMTLGTSGLAASLGAYPRVLDALALAGAAFLLHYGSGAFRRALSPGSLRASGDGAAQPLRRVVMQTLAVTLLNPHVYLDTVLLVGAIGAGQPAALRPAFLMGTATASVGWFATLGFGARLLRPVFARPGAWRVLDALVGVTMWTLAVALAAGVPRG